MYKHRLKSKEIEENKKKPLTQRIPLTRSMRGKTFHFNNFNKQEKGIESLKNSEIEITEISQNLLKIKIYNYYYLLDRNKYDINAIMMLLDIHKINLIKDIFLEYPNGIEKFIFIKQIKKIINNIDDFDLPNLIYGLYKFFEEIDYNGNGIVEWEEFTQFIIDKVEGDSEAKNVKEEKNKKIFNEKKMMKYKRYQQCKKIKDNHLYKNENISAVFIPKIDLVMMNEYGTRFLKLYNPNTGKIKKILDIEEYINENSLKKSKEIKDSSYKESKEKEIKKKNYAYRVLSITRYQSIIAICLSDKRIIFLNFEIDNRIELLHEMTLPVLEKRIWFLKEHNMWVTSGSKLSKFNFFTLNELDIDIKYNGQKYEFLYNENHPYRNHYIKKSSVHTSEIMDCIEIIKPLLILTACMDGKIRIINIETKEVIKIWNYHKLGIKQLDYNKDLNDVLSVGFEYYINIYNIKYSLEDAYQGKLEGNFAPIINCQFIKESYFAISVDEEGNVRIWNIKTKICIQFIPQLNKKCKINNLLIIPKYNKFIIYGNRIIYYESQIKIINNKEDIKEDNYPTKILYNNYYQNFYVSTYKDIRVYTNKGQIINIFRNLIQENFEPDVKIKNFLFENNHRKMYVGFSNGIILQFNAGNGSLIKSINEDETIKEKEYNINHEISGLYYYIRSNNDNLLISTSYDGSILISDEKNPEKSEIIKKIKGGHTNNQKQYEILCMDFSDILNIYATGGNDGLIILWDFEMSKIINILTIITNVTYKIIATFIKFLDPFPILASSFSDGTIYLFELYNNNNYRCILRSRNYYCKSSKINLCNIEYMNIYYGNLPTIKADNIDNFCLKQYFNEEYKIIYLKEKKERRDKLNKEKKEIENKENNEEKIEEEDLNIVPDIYKDEIIYKDLIEENENSKLKYYLIIGDEHGYLKIINLYYIFKKYNIKQKEKKEIKSILNLYKKEEINVSYIMQYLLGKKQDIIFPKYTNMYYNLIRLETKIHLDKITCIEIIKEPLYFTTCSKDNTLKIFNFNGDCKGKINILPNLYIKNELNIEWKFNIDETKLLEKEVKNIIDIFEKLGIEPILIGSDLDENIKRKIKEEKKEKIIIDKKNKENKKEKKSRFKKIIKIKKKEENEDDNIDEEVNEYMASERYYVKSSQNQIENYIKKYNNNKNGIVEIANQLIDITLKEETKRKILNEQKDFSEKDELNDINSLTPIIKKKKVYSTKDIMKKSTFNISSKTQKEENNKIKSPKFKNKSTINTFTDIMKLNKIKMDEISSDKNIPLIEDKMKILTPNNSNINKIIFPLYSPQNKNIHSENKIINNYNKIKKENNNIKKINILKLKKKRFKDELLTMRLYKKKDNNENKKCFSFENTMNKFNNKNNKILPNLFNKIIFQKGETEKLLNYQFYNSAYKSCCDQTKRDGINNIPIKTNYKNNWKMVKEYIKNRKIENNRKTTGNITTE